MGRLGWYPLVQDTVSSPRTGFYAEDDTPAFDNFGSGVLGSTGEFPLPVDTYLFIQSRRKSLLEGVASLARIQT